MSIFQDENIRALARHTISVESDQWTIQGLGMLRLPLGNGYRLHIWDDRFRWVNDARHHSHPWSFKSGIISGELCNIRYHEQPVSADAWGGAVFTKQPIKCGVGSCIVGEPSKVMLTPMPTETYRPGQTYTQQAEEVHLTSAINGTITVIRRWDDKEIANVYYRERWDSAEVRKATPAELQAIITNALDLMASEDRANAKL
jgi:hypothetical protein